MFLRSQILWKSNEFPVWKISSRKTNVYIYTHIQLPMTTYTWAHTHIFPIYMYQDPKNSWDLLHRLQFEFSSWKLRIAGGDWGKSRLVKSIDNSPRPSFLKSIGFWLLVQTGIEFAEDADTRIPRRNCQSDEVADLPLFQAHWDSLCPKNGINFL